MQNRLQNEKKDMRATPRSKKEPRRYCASFLFFATLEEIYDDVGCHQFSFRRRLNHPVLGQGLANISRGLVIHIDCMCPCQGATTVIFWNLFWQMKYIALVDLSFEYSRGVDPILVDQLSFDMVTSFLL